MPYFVLPLMHSGRSFSNPYRLPQFPEFQWLILHLCLQRRLYRQHCLQQLELVSRHGSPQRTVHRNSLTLLIYTPPHLRHTGQEMTPLYFLFPHLIFIICNRLEIKVKIILYANYWTASIFGSYSIKSNQVR